MAKCNRRTGKATADKPNSTPPNRETTTIHCSTCIRVVYARHGYRAGRHRAQPFLRRGWQECTHVAGTSLGMSSPNSALCRRMTVQWINRHDFRLSNLTDVNSYRDLATNENLQLTIDSNNVIRQHSVCGTHEEKPDKHPGRSRQLKISIDD